MWRPATKQITGTNEGSFTEVLSRAGILYEFIVPLGQRRRFGPAPAEDAAPPQLAQPSPSAYPRPQQHEQDSPKRGRDESPVAGKLGSQRLTQLPSPRRHTLSMIEVHSNIVSI